MKKDCYFDYDYSTNVCHGWTYAQLYGLGVVIEVVFAVVVYICIRCCCPTSLRRERKGYVLNDNISPPAVMQPSAVQQAPPSFEHARMDNNPPVMPPPPYSTLPGETQV